VTATKLVENEFYDRKRTHHGWSLGLLEKILNSPTDPQLEDTS
jgi:hypothetical protein